jgi:hypothetical protein
MQELIEQFEKEYRFLHQSLNRPTRSPKNTEPSTLGNARPNEFIVKMRDTGLSPISCNT